MNLSAHFTLAEFTTSQTAERYDINNEPPDSIVLRLTALCEQILEPARIELGGLRISSGYRCPELNALVGGSPTSAHVKGYAADVIPMQVSKKTFATWVRQNCKFDQIILEYGVKSMDGEPAWIHVSCDPHNRGQVLRIYTGSGGYKPIKI